MKISSLKLLVTFAACCSLLIACQQPTGMQGGIVDNGNKPGGSTGPIIGNPEQHQDPGGKVDGSRPNNFLPLSVLGGRHAITSLPTGFSLRQVDNKVTHILDTPNIEAMAGAKLILDRETVCQSDGEMILKTVDGGQLFNCDKMQYELNASNGDRIIVTNGTLRTDVLFSILRSMTAR